jgi:ubiquinone/menaquinone biosynthesis C-methylase UbiE
MVITSPAASAALADAGVALDVLLWRQQRGDWGDEDEYSRGFNDFAAEHALPVVSRYPLPNGAAVALVTTADRSATHVLVPEETEPVELSAAEGYAEWSRTYDAELNLLIVVEQAYVDRVLDDLKFETVLDAATGTGRHALALARRGARVTAFDTSREMLTIARRRVQAEGPPVQLVEASLAGPLPFRSGVFDLVVCGLAFCHQPDLRGPCREFARVARLGAHLLLTDFHPDSLAHGWRTEMWQGATHYRLPNMPHRPADYVTAVEEAGFTIHEVQEIPIAALPPVASHPALLRELGEMKFCLAIIGELL